MASDIENAGITELHVRMDCNGCVQKVRKALHGVEGVYDTCIDFPQQKVTVVGRASPEKLVKAIKKTRKVATICSHKEATEASNPEQPPANFEPPATETPAEAPATEAVAPPEEPPKEAVAPQESVPHEEKPAAEPSTDAAQSQPEGSAEEGKDVGEVPMVHHYPHQYGQRFHYWNNYGMPSEVPYHVTTHSYNTYRPTSYISENGYLRPSPQNHQLTVQEAFSEDYYHGSRSSNDGSSISSIFSDENPNACTIA